MVHDFDSIKKAIEELDKQLEQTKTLKLYLMEQYQLALEIEQAKKIEQQELDLKLNSEEQTNLPLE